jgi:hypothetical protein
MDHGTIRMLLLAAGWKEKDVARALAEHALELPVPAPPDSGGARDAFLHLSAFAALYASAIAGVSLLFDSINHWFPDAAMDDGRAWTQDWNLRSIRWSLATLLVTFPVFFFVSRFLLREMAANHEKAWSGVRRWLTYLTLFVAAVAMASDIVTLVFYLLEGELSIRFLLKVLVVAVVSTLAMAYYLATMRMPAKVLVGSRMHRTFGLTAIALAAGTFLCGSLMVGNPSIARSRKLDARRTQDLAGIENVITGHCRKSNGDNEWTMANPLPATLDEVMAVARIERPRIVDPATQLPYEYRVTGETTFELCAVFDGPSGESAMPKWDHPAGRHCFVSDVLKDDL